jgi:hypothetical protein
MKFDWGVQFIECIQSPQFVLGHKVAECVLVLYAYNKDITLSITVDSYALITSFSSY